MPDDRPLDSGIRVLPDGSGAWVLVDKPAGMTSRDVVNAITRITGIKKAGHAGTLDPMATGLLVVGVGRGATKQLGEGLSGSKAYLATMRFGSASLTHDVDAAKVWDVEVRTPSYTAVRDAMTRIGSRKTQVPPLVSALKTKGQAFHKVARRGWWLPRDARPVDIGFLSLERWDAEAAELHFMVRGSGGLYVRSIVRDMGMELGVPAVLTALRRIQAGPFQVDEAIPLDELEPRWRDHGITLD